VEQKLQQQALAQGDEVWVKVTGRSHVLVTVMGKVLEVSADSDVVRVELFHQLNLPVVFEQEVKRARVEPVRAA
jgi:hypothetical protein